MSFGLYFGELVRLHRGEQGLSQAALAIRAFNDESRKSRISELENGKVANPDQAIVDALVVALNLCADDVSACRTKGREKTGILTFEQHEKNVRERLKDLEAKLADATTDRTTLEQQVAEARRRLSNMEADYARTTADLAEARALLDRYDNQFEREKVDAARRALDRGDRTLADALFGEAQEALTRQADDWAMEAAKLAYERGKLAEDDIRWHDADRHYGEAARLSPTYDHLIAAGMFADYCGDYRRGARIKEQLVELAEAEFGPKDPRTATALNNLAVSYRAQARYAEAEPIYRCALKIGEKTLGSDHPKVATSLNNLAGLLEETGRVDEAEPLYRRALEIDERTLGSDHPDVATSLNNLALLLKETGRVDEAEPLYERAVAIALKALGEDHPNTQKVIANYEIFKATRPDR